MNKNKEEGGRKIWSKTLATALVAILLVGVISLNFVYAGSDGHRDSEHINSYVGIGDQPRRSESQHNSTEMPENHQQKASEEIQAAEEAIAEADDLIGPLEDPPQAALVLLRQAKEHLANAVEAYEDGKYGEAYGLANAAERLARNAIRKLGDVAEKTEDEVENEEEQPPAEENLEQPIEEEEPPVEENVEQPIEQSENIAAEVSIDENSDNTPPTIHSVWVDPSTIAQGESTTVYVDVTDDLSEIESVHVLWQDSSGERVGGANIRNVTSEGVWYGTISVAEHARPGTWTIDVVHAYDEAGNSTSSRDCATFEVKGVVLTTKIISAPSEIQSGETVNVEVDVTNDTAGATASGIEVYSYIGDITSGIQTVDLAPSETKTLTLSIMLDGLEPGTYTLGVVAKYENQVSEAKQSISAV